MVLWLGGVKSQPALTTTALTKPRSRYPKMSMRPGHERSRPRPSQESCSSCSNGSRCAVRSFSPLASTTDRLTCEQDVLKFEYSTQLLLDSNYIPLILKLFAHQDIQQVVDSKTDRLENRYVIRHKRCSGPSPSDSGDSFFYFCKLRAPSRDDDGDSGSEIEGEEEEE